jgi:DNA-directed RNA polymerase subunit E'/Rpb7
MELGIPIVLKDTIFLSATDINSKIGDTILQKIKKDVEKKCIKAGYVMPDSVKIISRSLGSINNSNFTSVITYNVIYQASICNPGVGTEIKCYVASIDKSQIVCYIYGIDISPMEIYLHKNHHVGNVEFVNLKVNDKVLVKILASKFNFGDEQIIAIGQFVSNY